MEENLTYLFETKKFNDEECIKETILDILFSRKEIETYSFIKNFAGFVANDLGLDNIEFYIDNNLESDNLDNTRVTKSTVAYQTIIGNKIVICLSPKMFTKKSALLSDCVVVAHELKHAQIYTENCRYKRYIGKNCGNYITGFYRKYFVEYGFDNASILSCYIDNKNEKMANNYSYNLVINLANKIVYDLLCEKDINATFFGFYKLQLVNLYQTYKDTVNTNDFIYEYKVKPLFDKYLTEEVKMLKKYAAALPDIEENKKYKDNNFDTLSLSIKELQKKIVDNVSLSINLLTQIYDKYLFNNLKNVLEKDADKSIIFFYLYRLCLNCPYYQIKQKDIDFMDSLYIQYNIPFDFDYIKMDKKELITYYLQKHGINDKGFYDYLIKTYHNMEFITSSLQLNIVYKTFKENENSKQEY